MTSPSVPINIQMRNKSNNIQILLDTKKRVYFSSLFYEANITLIL